MKTGREKFSKFYLLIIIVSKAVKLLPNPIINFLLVLFRNLPGYAGLGIRFILLKAVCKDLGKNVSIHTNVYIKNPENLSLGNNVSIHPMSYLECVGGITIGNDVSIAHASSLISHNHTWGDKSTPIKYNKLVKERILIENDVWIGCGVRILAGVHVKYRSVIAAGAVVNKDVDQMTIVGGVPSKKISDII